MDKPKQFKSQFPFFKEDDFNLSMRQVAGVISASRSIVDKAKEKGLEMTQELFEDFASKGIPVLYAEFEKQALESVEKLPIQSQIIKNKLIESIPNDAMKEAQAFEGARERLIRAKNNNRAVRFDLPFITEQDIEIKNSNACLKEGVEERIRAALTTDIETPNQKQFWQLLSNLSQAYNHFEAFYRDVIGDESPLNMFPEGLIYDYFLYDGESEFKTKPNPMAIKIIDLK